MIDSFIFSGTVTLSREIDASSIKCVQNLIENTGNIVASSASRYNGITERIDTILNYCI